MSEFGLTRSRILTSTLQKHVVYPFVHYTKLDALESTFRTRVHKHVLLALVIERLDYCNSLLYGLPTSYTNKLKTGSKRCRKAHLPHHGF